MTDTDDHGLAASLAEGAGALLLSLRQTGSASGPQGDAASDRYLLDRLHDERPDDAILSEESADDARRLGAERVWIIDPLDGSREFAEHDHLGRWRDDFAVHVALWTRREGLAVGAVALPARGALYRSDAQYPPSARPEGPLRVAVSRTRPPTCMGDLARGIELEQVAMGSAGVKAMAVVTGEVDAYLHCGGQYEWDSAAPVAVASAARLHASRIDGSPLRYNRASPWLPDLLICRRECAEFLLGRLAGWGETS